MAYAAAGQVAAPPATAWQPLGNSGLKSNASKGILHCPTNSPCPPMQPQTAKSLGGGGVQANARDQLLRHHYSAMDRLVGAGRLPLSPFAQRGAPACFQCSWLIQTLPFTPRSKHAVHLTGPSLPNPHTYTPALLPCSGRCRTG